MGQNLFFILISLSFAIPLQAVEEKTCLGDRQSTAKALKRMADLAYCVQSGTNGQCKSAVGSLNLAVAGSGMFGGALGILAQRPEEILAEKHAEVKLDVSAFARKKVYKALNKKERQIFENLESYYKVSHQLIPDKLVSKVYEQKRQSRDRRLKKIFEELKSLGVTLEPTRPGPIVAGNSSSWEYHGTDMPQQRFADINAVARRSGLNAELANFSLQPGETESKKVLLENPTEQADLPNIKSRSFAEAVEDLLVPTDENRMLFDAMKSLDGVPTMKQLVGTQTSIYNLAGSKFEKLQKQIHNINKAQRQDRRIREEAMLEGKGKTDEKPIRSEKKVKAKIPKAPNLDELGKKGADVTKLSESELTAAFFRNMGKIGKKSLPAAAGAAMEPAACLGDANAKSDCLKLALTNAPNALAAPSGCSAEYSINESINNECKPVEDWNPNLVRFLASQDPEYQFKELVHYPQFCGSVLSIYQKTFPIKARPSCQGGGVVIKVPQGGLTGDDTFNFKFDEKGQPIQLQKSGSLLGDHLTSDYYVRWANDGHIDFIHQQSGHHVSRVIYQEPMAPQMNSSDKTLVEFDFAYPLKMALDHLPCCAEGGSPDLKTNCRPNEQKITEDPGSF